MGNYDYTPYENVPWMLIEINEIQTFGKIGVSKDIILLGQPTSIGMDIFLNRVRKMNLKTGRIGISPAITLAYHLK